MTDPKHIINYSAFQELLNTKFEQFEEELQKRPQDRDQITSDIFNWLDQIEADAEAVGKALKRFINGEKPLTEDEKVNEPMLCEAAYECLKELQKDQNKKLPLKKGINAKKARRHPEGISTVLQGFKPKVSSLPSTMFEETEIIDEEGRSVTIIKLRSQ